MARGHLINFRGTKDFAYVKNRGGGGGSGESGSRIIWVFPPGAIPIPIPITTEQKISDETKRIAALAYETANQLNRGNEINVANPPKFFRFLFDHTVFENAPRIFNHNLPERPRFMFAP